MKISYNWLREYVPVDLPVETVSDQLTMVGLEVDAVEAIGSNFEGIVVGNVISVAQHPDADRLVVCQVDVATGEHLQIVCGAPNVAAGQLVPVAMVGASLTLPPRNEGDTPATIKIKKSKLRGVVSQGMICAEDELGLSDDHDGIMVLDSDANIGEPFSDYLNSKGLLRSDSVFDIALTPNRPDAICHSGVARDIAALNDLPLTLPAVSVLNAASEGPTISVTIEDKKACRRYVALVVRGITVKDSPAWLADRLRAIGLRPRNNIVDITNYVMHELGQPLHAFDLDTISNKSITVRSTSAKQTFVTLDGKSRELEPGTPMIADGNGNVAIAGVMGGENSEVSDSTKNVLIESAYFDAPTIRRVAKSLGLQTDASYRFERGVDPEGQLVAATRAADLMVELGGGVREDSAVDVRTDELSPTTISVRPERASLIIGTEVATPTMVAILQRLGFEVVEEEGILSCTVPSFRHDVEREIDVIEEIARIFGFDNIPEPESIHIPKFVPRLSFDDVLRRRVQHVLVGNGYSEIYTNSLLSPTRAEAGNDAVLLGTSYEGDVVTTANAISSEMSAMRPSLLPGMLGVISHNLNHGQESVKVFEFGHIFKKGDRDNNVIPGYIEVEGLCFSCTGATPAGWNTASHETTIFDLKGVMEAIFSEAKLNGLIEYPHYDASRVTDYRVEYRFGEAVLATVGHVKPQLAVENDIDHGVFFAEINWSAFTELARSQHKEDYTEIDRFPVVSRDIAVIVSETVEASSIVSAATKMGGKLLQSVNVFDVYAGKGIEQGKKSLALNFRFGAGRTLKDVEVDKAVRRIVETLSKEFDAILRQ